VAQVVEHPPSMLKALSSNLEREREKERSGKRKMYFYDSEVC
jgi:hypothetical protein